MVNNINTLLLGVHHGNGEMVKQTERERDSVCVGESNNEV